VTPEGPAPAHDSIGDAVRAHLPMVAAGAVAFVAFDGAAALRGDASAASYALVMAILFVTVATADRWVGFTTPLLWCMVAWATLHLAGGLVVTGPHRVLYNEPLGIPGVHYDRLVHAFGFGTATVACWQALRRYPPTPVPTAGLVLLAALAALGLGALNEVVEFLITRVQSSTSIGGYRNTGFDLISNTIGASIAAAWIYWQGRRAAEPAATPLAR
jgi:putative membrane protein